jgi:hypothetical protein
MIDSIELIEQGNPQGTAVKPIACIDYDPEHDEFTLTDYERIPDPDYKPVRISTYLAGLFFSCPENIKTY